jgi:drug/metabolite transporter (DMT)-like permease
MVSNILLRILSEAILVTYPTAIKNLDIPVNYFLWSRMVISALISMFFINWKTVATAFGTWQAWSLSLLIVYSNYVAYHGMKVVESGIAMTFIYMYPLLIILFSRCKFDYRLFILIIIGIALLVSESDTKKENVKKGIKYTFTTALLMALIYFNTKLIKSENTWDIIFISFILGAIITTFCMRKELLEYSKDFKQADINNKHLAYTFIFHIIAGIGGQFLRTYTIPRLSPMLYSILAYSAIVFGYIYGLIFNNEQLTVKKILGSSLIIISNIMAIVK